MYPRSGWPVSRALDHAEQRSLSRLGLKDFSALLKDAFRSDRLALDLAGKIGEKSDGNPFFAFEIIRGLREGRLIAQQADGTWVKTQVIQDVQVPSSVLDLVNARVGGVPMRRRLGTDRPRESGAARESCAAHFRMLVLWASAPAADVAVT